MPQYGSKPEAATHVLQRAVNILCQTLLIIIRMFWANLGDLYRQKRLDCDNALLGCFLLAITARVIFQ